MGKVVLSLATGDCRPAKGRVHVGDYDLRTSDSRALVIGHRAANGRGRDLRVRGERNSEQQR